MMKGANNTNAIFLGSPRWCSFIRTDHDHRATGIIDSLAEQVSTERPVLPLSLSESDCNG